MPNGSNEVEELLLEVGLGEGGAGLLVLVDVGNERPANGSKVFEGLTVLEEICGLNDDFGIFEDGALLEKFNKSAVIEF